MRLKMNRELAELLVEKCGWEESRNTDGFDDVYIWKGNIKSGFLDSKLDTDLNALAQVWRELKERGLFWKWMQTMFPKHHPYYSTSMIYNLLTDPKGQVEAAVKVLREEKGGK